MGRDTWLARSVAIKMLPPEVAGDPARKVRFERLQVALHWRNELEKKLHGGTVTLQKERAPGHPCARHHLDL